NSRATTSRTRDRTMSSNSATAAPAVSDVPDRRGSSGASRRPAGVASAMARSSAASTIGTRSISDQGEGAGGGVEFGRDGDRVGGAGDRPLGVLEAVTGEHAGHQRALLELTGGVQLEEAGDRRGGRHLAEHAVAGEF